MDCLGVGMRLDVVLPSRNVWSTGTILKIANHKQHVEDNGHDDPSCQPDCGNCIRGDGFTESAYDCVLIACEKDVDEEDDEWMSLDPCCVNCKKKIRPRLRPFLSAWGDSHDRSGLDMDTYMRPGIHYPRPYLDHYTAWIVHQTSEFLSDKICLRITDNEDDEDIVYQEIDLDLLARTYNFHNRAGFDGFVAMTCDDNGRIYALTRPHHNLVVFTFNKHSDDYDLVMYATGDTIFCDEPSRGTHAFILSIHDSSMVLDIQQLQHSEDGPMPLCTYTFALPLVQPVTPALQLE